MKRRPINFDPLARIYRTLEVVAFGRDLARARLCHLDHLAGCRSILVLGEGDGRFVSRLVHLAPHAEIRCVDSSSAMIEQARRRLAEESAGAETRVTFEKADALTLRFPAAHYDAVVTLFFLDCFTEEDVARIVPGLAEALTPAATWLYADFAMPPRGVARLRAKVWLGLLYGFFRLSTGLRVRSLPNAEGMIQHAGFAPVKTHTFQAGMLRSVAFCR